MGRSGQGTQKGLVAELRLKSLSRSCSQQLLQLFQLAVHHMKVSWHTETSFDACRDRANWYELLAILANEGIYDRPR